MMITNSDQEKYDDGEDVYWRLCTSLADNIDRLVAPSAHIMFWLSMQFYSQTVQFFSKPILGLEINRFPLIWCRHKSILPTADYGPRRGYETALLISRGKRKVVRSVQNFFLDNSSEKLYHTSEKPKEMLRHFFSMLVDDNTTFLDPTCGGGTSVCVARELKAKSALGIEINPTFAENAKKQLQLS